MISPKDYMRAVPKPLWGISVGLAVHCLRKFYCPRMLHIDQCSTDCSLCAEHICKIMQDFQDFPSKINEYSVLSYLIKKEVAAIADMAEAVTVVERHTWLGEEIRENPFVRAGEEL